MDWIQQAVGEFLGGIGFPGLSLDATGFVRLHAGQGGAMEMQHMREESPPSLMLAWSEPDPWKMSEHLKTAFRMANFRAGGALPLMVAAHADQLVLATRVPERSVSRSALEDSMQWLQQLHEQIRNS